MRVGLDNRPQLEPDMARQVQQARPPSACDMRRYGIQRDKRFLGGGPQTPRMDVPNQRVVHHNRPTNMLLHTIFRFQPVLSSSPATCQTPLTDWTPRRAIQSKSQRHPRKPIIAPLPPGLTPPFNSASQRTHQLYSRIVLAPLQYFRHHPMILSTVPG